MRYLLYVIIAFACLIILFSYDFGASDGDYLILLGGGLSDDRETLTMTGRVDRAARYLRKYPDCKVIVSGGITGNNTVSETKVMRDLLLEYHIQDARIIPEDKSQNTKENILFSRKLIEDGAKTVICSSDYHILRAKLIALKQCFKVNSISSRSASFQLIWHLPLEMILIIRDLIL